MSAIEPSTEGAVSVIRNVCAGDVSTPPLLVPPLSCNRTVTSAVPAAPAAWVNVSVPAVLIAGPTANRAGLSVVTRKIAGCGSPGPAEMPVAQPATVRASEPTAYARSAPFVNDGASLIGANDAAN